jgi:hypothetical protein
MPFSQRGVKDYFQQVGFYCKILYLNDMTKLALKAPLGQICQAILISSQPT